MPTISAILLGAGASKRMGVDKLSLPWGRKTVLEHCFETLLRSKVQELVIVLGVRNKGKRNLFRGREVKVVTNPHSEGGMSTSIRMGLRAVHLNSHGILIALGDQPLLRTRTINALIGAFAQEKGKIIVPSFRGRKGHPVIFHKRYKKELLRLRGDVGGRSVIERHPEEVRLVRTKSEGVVKDIDTWGDYAPPHLPASQVGREIRREKR
ncbi:MAG: molybdenum cofactor cytidylyltransferase [Thermodesulfobacteriota bacterium]|jgi:molybdenum cofactor cytidylyltransferase